MTKNTFAKRLSEQTGLDRETAMKVLGCIDERNIFSKKEQALIAGDIAETAGCGAAEGEKIRRAMMKLISDEIKRQSKVILKVSAAVLVILTVRAKLKK